MLFKVNIFDITQHDETDFSDAVVNSIIRGWAQGEKNDRPVKSARIRGYTKSIPGEEKLETSGKYYVTDCISKF